MKKSRVKKVLATIATVTIVGLSGVIGTEISTLPTDNKVAVSNIGLGFRGETLKTSVNRVVDGDTFEIVYEGKPTKVRLIGVDTPETVKSGIPVEWYGKDASDFTKKLIEGKQVTLEFDKGKLDLYNRLLAYVYLPNGDMLNVILLHRGFAKTAFYSPNTKYKKVFLDIEAKAKDINIGRWDVESQSVWESVYGKKK